ncbi:MAG: hypothetical protein EXS14_04650 [Planctomycetes bacterium]|nr:hypothetical protein [Planctomycetota bacterium]
MIAAIAIVLRLHQLQVTEGERWLARAEDSRGGVSTLPGERGSISDVEGVLLARDQAAVDVSVLPSAFREQSLLHALADALVLSGALGAELSAERSKALRWECVTDPSGALQRLARMPARSLLTDDNMPARMDTLLPPHGVLPRRREEGAARLAEALRVLQGSGLRVPVASMAKLPGTFGNVAEWDVAGIAARCLEELRLLSALARTAAGDLPALMQQLDALGRREELWKQRQVRHELRDAAALDHFGTAAPALEELGPDAWRALVQEAAAPFADEDQASAALARCAAWLGGGIPTPSMLSAVDGSDDAIAAALAFGLVSQESEGVLDAWFAVRSRELEATPLRARRERELRALWRRGRSYVLLCAAEPQLSALVTGPGRLGRIGFSVSPRLVRQPLSAAREFRGLGLLLGGVASETGEATVARSVEAALHERLRATDGESVAGRAAGGDVLLAPQHGTPVRLTLDWKVQRAVEDALGSPESSEPGALVLLDITTGGVIAMVSTPLPRVLSAALAERRELENERTLLRRVLGRGEGWARQRLLSLRGSAEAESEASRSEFAVLQAACDSSGAELQRRLDVLGERLAISAAYHRAVDSPEHLPPGSVFKAVTVLAALQEGVCNAATPFECRRTEHRDFLRCKGHGATNAHDALKFSCNAWCYDAGSRLGVPRLIQWYRKFGMFEPVPGLMEADERLARELLRDDARALAIGGGSLRVAPVRAAGIAASIATGRVVRPRLIVDPSIPVQGVALAAEKHLATVRAGMRAVVQPGGTAGTVPGLGHLRIAAKTGTADYEASSGERLHQAWFVGWAPAGPGETPRIAFAAMLAHTHDQGADAAPMAARALDAYGAARPERKWW